ncbi:MAG: Type 1 glutamine amidotransferase-like domain-containing protein [Candidatus Moraniibacteriota bacterium]
MLLYLTSVASKTLNLLVSALPRPASEMNLIFIDTAATVEDGPKPWLQADIEACRKIFQEVAVIDVASVAKEVWMPKISKADVIFFSGGNTFYLLQEVRKSGLDEVVKKRVQEGAVYIGSSAGALLAGPTVELAKDADDPGRAPGLTSFEGLSLVNFVPWPHFVEEQRDELEVMQREYKEYQFIPLADDEAVLVKDGESKILRSKAA